ncbi:Unknown protein [Striga hermonthica]|uniref:Uncharacterized protein n=1 Tax=Striga hermonthica TaxID=68872 RepID=A0A9N7MRY6_STRHE|nr:Unknown protein [Striga hermonthica]
MDREQKDMRSFGLIGIYKETFKLIFNLRKIFTQITLTLILPLSIIFLAHKQVSDKILSGHHRFEWAAYITLNLLYFILALFFSLLSTSAVVYAVACSYASREVTFPKIMRAAVPRFWKRLAVTFVCAVLTFAAYNAVLGATFYLWRAPIAALVGLLVLYIVGFVCLSAVWQLAGVVSVLEERRGFGAAAKGMRLAKGRVFAVGFVFVVLDAVLVGVNVAGFLVFVTSRGGGHVVIREVGLGAVCVVVLTLGILFGLVVQTVVYFVCKAEHGETIDRAVLADQVEVVYLGAAPKDVQIMEGPGQNIRVVV